MRLHGFQGRIVQRHAQHLLVTSRSSLLTGRRRIEVPATRRPGSGRALTVAVLIWLRVPMLGTRLGAGAGAAQLGFTALGLLLDAGRLRGGRAGAPAAVVP